MLFLLRAFSEDFFSFLSIYSYVKTDPRCGLNLPLGIMIWTKLNLCDLTVHQLYFELFWPKSILENCLYVTIQFPCVSYQLKQLWCHKWSTTKTHINIYGPIAITSSNIDIKNCIKCSYCFYSIFSSVSCSARFCFLCFNYM